MNENGFYRKLECGVWVTKKPLTKEMTTSFDYVCVLGLFTCFLNLPNSPLPKDLLINMIKGCVYLLLLHRAPGSWNASVDLMAEHQVTSLDCHAVLAPIECGMT